MLLEGFIFMVIFFSGIHYTNRTINRRKMAEEIARIGETNLPTEEEASADEIVSDQRNI